MATKLCKWVSHETFRVKACMLVRNAHRMRGRPPTEAKTLQQRLEEMNKIEYPFSVRIDIGLPSERYDRSKAIRLEVENRKKMKADADIERLSRNQQLIIDLEDVKEEWFKNRGPSHIKRIAEHYSIFEHLYIEGYFYPKVFLNIGFAFEDKLCPVYFGNTIKPNIAQCTPEVAYESDKESLWTLTLINLDGNFINQNKEFLHWCVTNIPGSDLSKGDTVVEYLQPIPSRGVGYHRYVFVLYKQNNKVEFDMHSVKQFDPLEKRTFVTRDWYKKYQNDITPAGLAFFQSDWDPSLKDVYHNQLNMKEPVFEYDFPKPYVKPQTMFPLREAFNLYMDRYRDPKQINKEFLMRKLKDEHPFKKPDPPLKYPNAQRLNLQLPSWLRLQEKKYRQGWGRVNEVP